MSIKISIFIYLILSIEIKCKQITKDITLHMI